MDVTILPPRKTMAAMTKTPEEWLNEVSAEKARGIFKLFLGYAPGVGKTYSMLSEAIRRASRGEGDGERCEASSSRRLNFVQERKL